MEYATALFRCNLHKPKFLRSLVITSSLCPQISVPTTAQKNTSTYAGQGRYSGLFLACRPLALQTILSSASAIVLADATTAESCMDIYGESEIIIGGAHTYELSLQLLTVIFVG